MCGEPRDHRVRPHREPDALRPLHGFAVGECMWRIEAGRVVLGDVIVRQAARFCFDVDHRCVCASRSRAADPHAGPQVLAVPLSGDHDDDPYGRGLAHELYWPVYFQAEPGQVLAHHTEKFGESGPRRRRSPPASSTTAPT